MKNVYEVFKGTLLKFDSIQAKNAYIGKAGFINVYWFEIEQENGYTTILPYILDYTYEVYEAKEEYWAIVQPLQSYHKSHKDPNLFGTKCDLEVSIDENGFPISIESVLMAQMN